MMHTRLLSGALVAAAMLGTATTVSAQMVDAPVLPLGRTMDGTLARTDATINERGRFKVYRLDAKAGQRYSIVMRADDFDSYLSVGRIVNGLTDYMASDDDGAGNNNARLRFTPKAAGVYYVVAQALAEDGLGDFTIRMDTLPPKRIVPPIAIAMGAPTTGTLSDTDAEVDEKGPYYDLYKFTARSGQRYVIEMSSSEFDSYVGVGRMDGDSVKVEETDDDGGGGNNSRLRFTAKEDGEYYIRAQSMAANGTGEYTLKIAERVTAPATISPIAAGVLVSGELTESDQEADDGTPFDAYKFTVRAGEMVTITMRSTDIDAFLVLGKMDGDSFTSMETDDDGGGSRNSRIEHTFDEAGEYVIRANVVGSPAMGKYTVRVDRAARGTTPRRRAGAEETAAADAAVAPIAPPAPPRGTRKP